MTSPAPFPILHESDELLVVNKPAGIAVIPGRGEPALFCLRARMEAWLAARDGQNARLWVVHRIDRDVSGALVLARTAAAHRRLSVAFEHGEVSKRYWALVEGVPERDSGVVDLPLRTGGHGGRTVVDRARGKPARTRWKVRERLAGCALLAVEPLTGRTHQIRVHLRAAGHPLAVDRRYGRRACLGPEHGGRVERATLHAERLILPAAAGAALEVEAPLPEELARLVAWLRKGARALPARSAPR